MIEERVAKLEARADEKDKHDAALLEEMRSIRVELSSMSQAMSKYKGFLGGIVFLGSCFYYAVIMGKDFVLKFFSIKTGN